MKVAKFKIACIYWLLLSSTSYAQNVVVKGETLPKDDCLLILNNSKPEQPLSKRQQKCMEHLVERTAASQESFDSLKARCAGKTICKTSSGSLDCYSSSINDETKSSLDRLLKPVQVTPACPSSKPPEPKKKIQ